MLKLTNVRSSTEPLQLEVNVDTVYIRTNIRSITTTEATVESVNIQEWEYDETQMTFGEYLETNKDFPSRADKALGELSVAVAEYQLQNDMAIAELSMALGGVLNV